MIRRLRTIAFCILVSAGGARASAQEVQTSHQIFANPAPCPEPNRIVVQLPPPRVEVRDASCPTSADSGKRCQLLPKLFHSHSHSEHRDHAPASTVLYAPVALPSMVIQAAPAPAAQVAVAPLMQQITHDFTAIRHAHEMEARTAAMEAQLAARNAMVKAENDYLARIMERNQQRLQAMANNCGAPAAGDGTSLNTALKNINDRLDQLERLVLEHHRVLQNSNPTKLP